MQKSFGEMIFQIFKLIHEICKTAVSSFFNSPRVSAYKDVTKLVWELIAMSKRSNAFGKTRLSAVRC